ncbi:hypothetical protein BKG96_06685 [Rodentibacter caecimuris]|uniref:Uncharacterized protein n=1 Tax=Rodentibacter caecimuris TaxID=1796644 RepID=A0A1V3KKK6_9PAST|nr:hypothetical protein [Rodentibacter heylii]OOF78174.1 hypothetical protein BKG96_06685 [Rodentibacter heylii]
MNNLLINIEIIKEIRDVFYRNILKLIKHFNNISITELSTQELKELYEALDSLNLSGSNQIREMLDKIINELKNREDLIKKSEENYRRRFRP